MTDERSEQLWQGIVKILEEKLQFGFLEQVKSIVDVRFEGEELTIVVSGEEAFDFFKADINQQRLMIVSRPIVYIEKILVERVEASSIVGDLDDK